MIAPPYLIYMLQTKRYIVSLLTVIVAFAFCGCSDDSAPEPTPIHGNESIVLRLNAEKPTLLGTRNVSASQPDVLPDTMGANGEMMKSWVIVVEDPDNSGKVFTVYNHTYADNDLHEQDTVATDFTWGKTYNCYCFANLTDAQLQSIGIKKADDATNPDDFDAEGWLNNGATLPTFSGKTIMVKGNHKDNPASDEITGNGDIPMTNTVQTVEIGSNDHQAHTYNLYVVRTVGKIRVEVSNPELVDLQVGQIDILDSLTSNAYTVTTVNPDDETQTITTSKDNLFLLPGAAETYSYETDIDGNPATRRKPNLNGTPLAYEGVTYTTDDNDNTVPKATVVERKDGNGDLMKDEHNNQLYDTIPGKKVFTFLVNESDLESVSSTSEGYKLRLTNGHEDSESQSVQRDYSFTDFTRIARNEIHVLPITLRRFDPRFRIEAFTAIGVVPTAIDRPDYALIQLGMYGQFHLVPTVRDWLDGTEVDLSNATSISFTPSIAAADYGGELSKDNVAAYLRIKWNPNAKTPCYEVEATNFTGYATYVFTATFDADNGSGVSEVKSVTRRVRITNTKIDFDDPDWSKRWRGGVRR